MKHLLAVALLLFVSAPAFAQTWTPARVLDTGWAQVNAGPCVPLQNDPQMWTRESVPLPPDGADLVRFRAISVEYRVVVEATNNAAQPVRVWGDGTVLAYTAHRPGLFNWHNGYYLPGGASGWDAFVGTGSSGGGSFDRELASGQHIWILVQTPTAPQSFVDTQPITPEWLEPNRRGAHNLFTTVTGGYSWDWWWIGTPPQDWSHAPVSYSSVTEARFIYSIEYGSLP